jgi:NADH-quinone oxidoreductase E subunit
MQAKDLSKIDNILKTHKDKKGSLIPVLQEVQAEFGYLPEAAIGHISKELKISESKIYGVLTFYAQFHTQPQGKNLLRVCCGTACHVQGGEQILDDIKETLELNTDETTPDGKFTLQEVACLGCCGLAPVLMLNDDVHGKVSKDKVEEIINYVK